MTVREKRRASETHPPLRERILQIGLREASAFDDTPAFDLIVDADRIEAALYGREGAARQEHWDAEVLQKLMSAWKADVLAGTRRRRRSITAEALAGACASLPSTATDLGLARTASEAAERTLMKGFSAALASTGWKPSWQGGRLIFHKDSTEIDPVFEILQLKTRQAEDWPGRCAELGITGMVVVPEPVLPGKGRFCSRCLRTFAEAVEFCPVCRKRIYG
jgi:hypothetical protein